MFYSRYVSYPHTRGITTFNSIGEEVREWQKLGEIKTYIVRTNFTRYTANTLDIGLHTYTGYIASPLPSPLLLGDKVGDYEVTDVREACFFAKRVTASPPHPEGA